MNELTHAIRQHYDSLAPYYRTLWGEHIHHGYYENADDDRHLAQQRLVDKLLEFASINGCSRVLDVGCGFGETAIYLSGKFNAQVVGITISPIQAEVVQKKLLKQTGCRVEIYERDANDLRSNELGQFDVVWCVECSEHLFDKGKFFKQCFELLAPSGTLALCTWAWGDAGDAEIKGTILDGMLLPSLLTMAELRGLAEGAGFSEVRVENITRQVQPTWSVCINAVRNSALGLLLERVDERTKSFVRAMDAMQRGYESGALSYLMLSGYRK